MQQLVRRLLVPVLATAALTLGATQAGAVVGQPKAELKIEGERAQDGARLVIKGKNWPAKSKVKITATRAPGARSAQDFGVVDTDDKGEFTLRKTAQCTTQSMDEGTTESVTFTAAEEASGTKATAKSTGAPWVCM
jgi:hypothetical protein